MDKVTEKLLASIYEQIDAVSNAKPDEAQGVIAKARTVNDLALTASRVREVENRRMDTQFKIASFCATELPEATNPIRVLSAGVVIENDPRLGEKRAN